MIHNIISFFFLNCVSYVNFWLAKLLCSKYLHGNEIRELNGRGMPKSPVIHVRLDVYKFAIRVLLSLVQSINN